MINRVFFINLDTSKENSMDQILNKLDNDDDIILMNDSNVPKKFKKRKKLVFKIAVIFF